MVSPDSENNSDTLSDNINSSFNSQDSQNQDIEDILLDAGYTLGEIQSILVSKTNIGTRSINMQ